MLLALDAGNTNITIGAFEAASSSRTGACAPSTSRPPTNGASCSATCSTLGTSIATRIDGIIIASVVPAIDSTSGRHGAALLPSRADVRQRATPIPA